MKIFEFLQEQNGALSSSRLFAFLVAVSAIIDWQRWIWVNNTAWNPEWQTIGLILGVLGFKLAQKPMESEKQPDTKPDK